MLVQSSDNELDVAELKVWIFSAYVTESSSEVRWNGNALCVGQVLQNGLGATLFDMRGASGGERCV